MPAMSTRKRLELPEGAEVSAVALVVLVGALGGRTPADRLFPEADERSILSIKL
jgi:hypothetical protein